MIFRGLWAYVLACVLFVCSVVHAQVPQKINYQGFLSSNTGVPVNSSSLPAPLQLTFKLYDANGALLWTEVQSNVSVTNGVFNVALGSVTPFSSATPSPLLFDKPYFLGVQVNNDPEMTPRQPLAASPYALRATIADVANAVTAGAPLKIGSDNAALCDAPHAGSLRWNAVAIALEVCDGVAWRFVAITSSTFTVSGTVSGLTTGPVVLQNNLSNNLSIPANGNFTFSSTVVNGSPYNVTVLTQPPVVQPTQITQPAGQICTVANGAGTVAGANVANVAVTCVNAFGVVGTVSGLVGTVVLQSNGALPNPNTITVNGQLAFLVPVGSAYNITVQTQPANQICTVSNGAGTANANTLGVAVSCANITSTIGGTVTGLSGTVVLQNNLGNNLSVAADGNFNFTTPLASGAAYNVTVLTSPQGQTCTVTNGAGTVGGANVTNVTVNCGFTIGGTVSGLSGTIVLNNGVDPGTFSVSANGSFTFPTSVGANRSYGVTVQGQPPGQTCSVVNGTGTVTNANITNVAVTCVSNNTFTVGGTVTGLTNGPANPVFLQINLGTEIKIFANGAFTFPNLLATASTYSVTVSLQPTGQTCSVTNGAGTIVGANVTNVVVTCLTNTFSVGGSITGLNGTVTLLNNGANSTPLSSNAPFTFSTLLTSGSTYNVTIATQPAGQTCTVTNGAGTGTGTSITNVAVNCVTNTFTMGGTVTGLSGTVVLQNNLGNDLSVSTSGGFTFTTALATASPYSVTVLTQPAGQICTVANSSGTVAAANVTNVSVTCAVISSAGTEFFLTLPDHLCVSQPVTCNNVPVTSVLRITAKSATSGQVTFNGVTTPFTVASGGESIVTLSAAAVLTSNDTVEAKGVRVTALAPVTVYAIVESQIGADGYLGLPTSGLGTAYYVMARSDPNIAGSVFAIAATKDATTVTITPTAAGANKPANIAFNVQLNAGQTYQFENPLFADLTGSLVSADKPIAVFAGHPCAKIPAATSFCDYLVEQLPDITRLGKKFRTLLFSGRTRYTVRIVGTVNGTILSYDHAVAGAPASLQQGQIADFIVTSGLEIVASHPVLVAQYMHGVQDQVTNLAGGDPSMVIVTPEEQGVTEAVFSVHGLAGTTGRFVNIVTASSALATLTLDGVAVNPALFSAVGVSGFSGAALPVAAGPHRLLGTAPFTAIVYDYGDPNFPSSYIYPVATNLAILPP